MVDVGTSKVEAPVEPPVRMSDRADREPGRVVRWTLGICIGAVSAQAAFLVGLSVVLFRRFTVAIDFGIFAQAWTRIGTGHLNPESTINGFPYWKSHFELLMWPLALLHPIVPSSIVLLFVQVVALVVTEVVVLLWVAALLRRAAPATAWRVVILVGTLLLLLANPVLYATAAEDFHFEPIATCFVVLAAYDYWSGRTKRIWLWVVLCLLCGDIGGLYVLGLGVTGIVAAKGDRIKGLLLIAVGTTWVGSISALGANSASDVATGYGYLAARHMLPEGVHGLTQLAGGITVHPDRAWDTLFPRWGSIFRYLESGGAVGMFTPWGFGVPLVALAAAGLQRSTVFITAPFQNVVVVPFVTFGTAWLVAWLASRWRSALGTVVAALVGVGALVGAGAAAVQRFPTVVSVNATTGIVPADRAAALRQVLAQTPDDAEVVASVPVIGRFGQREYLYSLVDVAVGTTGPVPVSASTVVVVMDFADAPQLLPPSIGKALAFELVARGGRVIMDKAGVLAVLWHPPPGTTQMHLP